MDQVWQVCENYLANEKDLFWPFLDLVKVYDMINRDGMLQMLRVYGVQGKLLKVVQSFYVDSMACVWVGIDLNKCFWLMFDLDMVV